MNEMSDADAKHFPSILDGLLGDHAEAVNGLFERFGHARPVNIPHLYVSMLGVRDQARGHGIGMALLAHVVEQADAQGIGAYLDSGPYTPSRRPGCGGCLAAAFRGGARILITYRACDASSMDANVATLKVSLSTVAESVGRCLVSSGGAKWLH